MISFYFLAPLRGIIANKSVSYWANIIVLRDVILVRIILLGVLMIGVISVEADTKADQKWRKTTHPIFQKYCTESCHNEADQKAGINLDAYDFVVQVVRRGQLFQKVVEQIENNQMPPPNKPQMTQAEKDSLLHAINSILDDALMDPNPGPSIMRRLSHREYTYTIYDLLGVQFDAKKYFPSEGSGGEGFDNQSAVLYITPLTIERYYAAADSIIRMVNHDQDRWKDIVPKSYKAGFFRRSINRVKGWFGEESPKWNKPHRLAKDAILPFASKAYRRFLSNEEEGELMQFFDELYFRDLWAETDGFDMALSTVFKRILISPSFLYRSEVNIPINKPYQISNFELASRLSYLLWSSMPDDTLIQVAYREDLHHPEVLTRETRRMMQNEKYKRFSTAFAPQWLGVEEHMTNPKADPTLYPELTDELASDMKSEVVNFFHHAYTKEKNLLLLLDSEYSMLNERLASFYGIEGVEGNEFRPVPVADHGRGGVMGMGAVLTATSLPGRTSPVLRGQWVLEQILGTPAPPPPPDVPELEAAKDGVHDELDLRALLEKHRAPSACAGCHQKMDPIGLVMESFDAIGRQRQYYRGEIAINTSAIMEDGTPIADVGDLRKRLVDEKSKFAKNFARKLLSYALGRGVTFTDSPTVKELTESLLADNFDTEKLMLTLINSYPFRHRISDMADLYIKT